MFSKVLKIKEKVYLNIKEIKVTKFKDNQEEVP